VRKAGEELRQYLRLPRVSAPSKIDLSPNIFYDIAFARQRFQSVN
jgi:hypothetical protein